MMAFGRLVSLLALAALAGCTTPSREPVSTAPRQQQQQFYVVAANPLAVEAGMNVLRRGGSAVDAAIAVEAMLSLVEPQSSGLGGGAFMTYYDATLGRARIYDGRETAPAGATPDMLVGGNGEALPFREAVVSGRATGVPGVVRMLHLAHSEHGRLPWSSLFGDAERTARDGFTISPRLGRMIASRAPQNSAPDVQAYFAEGDGTPLDAGDTLRNPAFFSGDAAAAARIRPQPWSKSPPRSASSVPPRSPTPPAAHP